MKSLFKSVAIITVFAVLTRIAGFLFRIFLSRSIGAEALGMYQVAFSVFMVLLTLVSSGLPLAISKFTAIYKAKGDKKGEHGMVTASLIIGLITSILLCGIVLIFHSLFSKIFSDQRCMLILIVLLPSVIFSSVYSTFRGSLWGHANYFAVCITELFEQVARIIICVIMLAGTFSTFDGALSAASSLSIACVLSAVFVTILYFYCGGRLGKPKHKFNEVLKSSVPITAVRFASSMIQPIIAIIIPLRLMAAGYTNAEALSMFGIAVGMTLPLLFIPGTLIGSLSMALIPDLAGALMQDDNNHINNRIRSSLLFALFISFLLVPIFIGAGENIGLFFYDNAQSGVLLSLAAWLMVPMGITNITSAVLNALGLEVKSFINNILGAVAMLLCIWFLPTVIGINALIVGMGLCSLITCVLNIWMIVRKTHIKLNLLKPVLLFAVFTIPVAAITSFLSSLLVHVFPLFFNLAISCSVGAVCFILLCMIFNILDIKTWYVEAKQKLNFKKKLKKVKAK